MIRRGDDSYSRGAYQPLNKVTDMGKGGAVCPRCAYERHRLGGDYITVPYVVKLDNGNVSHRRLEACEIEACAK